MLGFDSQRKNMSNLLSMDTRIAQWRRVIHVADPTSWDKALLMMMMNKIT